MELAPAALEDPAWDGMDEPLRSNTETALRAIVDRFDGVLVGVAPLLRHLIAQDAMGHRSTLEALAALVACDLLDERPADERPVFWVPDRLVRAEATPLDGAGGPRTPPPGHVAGAGSPRARSTEGSPRARAQNHEYPDAFPGA
jgi:hypothetical protein